MQMQIDPIRDEFATLESLIAGGPIVPNVTAGEIRAYLESRFDFRQPMPLDEVVADVEQMLRKWQVQVTHPRYFGLYNPSVTLASVVADTLVAIYNSQLANWRTSPVANEMERHTLAWLGERFGLPADSIATFTSGGSEANLSAVVVALTRAFPGYGEHGLRSLSGDPAIYLARETHHGFNKIAHMVGLGRRNLRVVATDSGFKMDVGDLRRCGRGSQQRAPAVHGHRHRRNNGCGHHRPSAGDRALLQGAGPVVSCRRRIRRLRGRFAQTQALAFRH